MKKIIVAGAVSAIAAVSFAGSASAFEPGTPQCFGQVHKAINKDGALGLENVGQLVKEIGGQGKNAAAKGLCTLPAE
jgi:hypothetical protein